VRYRRVSIYRYPTAVPTHHVYHCPPAPDVELNLARPHPLRCDLAWPDPTPPSEAPVSSANPAAKPKRFTKTNTPIPKSIHGTGPSELPGGVGLVVVIPGFGQDNDDGYLRAFRQWVAERFGLACLTVQYHGIRNRPNQGAAPQFHADDAARLCKACQSHGIAWPTPPQTPNLNALISQFIQANAQHAAQATQRGEEAPAILTLTCGLLAPDGPLNLGLSQALDHLHALQHLPTQFPIDPANVIALGSSHGGYLAQLCNKLAPNTFRAVLDNSGYAALPDRYINSRPSLTPDCYENLSPTVRIAYFVTSAWSHTPNPGPGSRPETSLEIAPKNTEKPTPASADVSGGQSENAPPNTPAPNHYHDDARALRNLAEPAHLEACIAAAHRPAVIRCVHAPGDDIAPTAEKQQYIEALRRAGVDATLQVMTDADVDGRYVKSLDHGLGLSLRLFFEKQYADLPSLNPNSKTNHKNDAERGTVLRLPGSSQNYEITHQPRAVTVHQT